jgi:NADH:ubiquinone oxidoreductase subunit 6 (subunit J)
VRDAFNKSILTKVMSTNNINLSVKKNNDQKEYVFAVAAIFFAVLFLVTLFYVKYSSANSNLDSQQKKQETLGSVVRKY